MLRRAKLDPKKYIPKEFQDEFEEVNGFLGEFKKFITRGNVIDLAVGVVIGAAFKEIVDSLVSDIIMPPIGLITNSVSFSSLYVNLGEGVYETLADAEAAGAPVLRYGLFIDTLINFIIISFVIFLVIRWINRFEKKKKVETKIKKQKCPYCISEIDISAVKCPFCTSNIPSKELAI